MTEPGGKPSLEERVKRLERRCVRLEVLLCLAVVATLASTLFSMRQHHVVERLTLVDDSGRTRLLVDMDEVDDAPCLAFYDGEGRQRIRMALDEHGLPMLSFLEDGGVRGVMTEPLQAPEER